MKKAKHSSII